MALTLEQKQALDKIAKAQADTQVAVLQKDPKQLAVVQKSLVKPTFAYHKPHSAPNVITKRDDEVADFRLTRLFKSMLNGDPDCASFELEMLEQARIEKAMGETIDTAGGYAVPVEYNPSMIEYLHAKTPIRQLGGMVIPMSRREMEIPRDTGGVTAYYGAENAAITASDGTLGQVALRARKLTCLVKMSNEAIQDATPAFETFVRQMIASALAKTETQKGIVGAGNLEPIGLINMPDINTQTAVAVGNLDYDDVIDMITECENAESDLTGFLTTPAIKGVLRKLKDPSTGLYLWRDALAQRDLDTLLARPATSTTLCKNPTTTTTHYIIGGNWADEFVIGDRMVIEYSVSKEAGFASDQVWIRAIARHDFVLRHPETFVVLPVTGVGA